MSASDVDVLSQDGQAPVARKRRSLWRTAVLPVVAVVVGGVCLVLLAQATLGLSEGLAAIESFFANNRVVIITAHAAGLVGLWFGWPWLIDRALVGCEVSDAEVAAQRRASLVALRTRVVVVLALLDALVVLRPLELVM